MYLIVMYVHTTIWAAEQVLGIAIGDKETRGRNICLLCTPYLAGRWRGSGDMDGGGGCFAAVDVMATRWAATVCVASSAAAALQPHTPLLWRLHRTDRLVVY